MLFSPNGFGGDRTHDSQIKSLILYQLSYEPKLETLFKPGLHPHTLVLTASRDFGCYGCPTAVLISSIYCALV